MLIGEKLLTGTDEEKRDVALIAWSLAANHQKAKVALRSLGLLSRLQLAAATCCDPVFHKVADMLKPSKWRHAVYLTLGIVDSVRFTCKMCIHIFVLITLNYFYITSKPCWISTVISLFLSILKYLILTFSLSSR